MSVPLVEKMLATSFAQPSSITAKLETMQPPIINGRLRPILLLHESDNTPTRGCTIRPDRGPARNTTLMADFDKPKLNKYGEAVSISSVITL